MNEHRQEGHRKSSSDGFPLWLNATVIITLLGLFVYNVVIVGEKGYPTNVLIAGLLGGYIGVDQFKRRKEGPPSPDAKPPPPNSGSPPASGGKSW